MVSRRVLRLFFLVVTVCAAASFAAAGTTVVRVHSDEYPQVEALGIAPEHDFGYDSFRWLVVSDSDLARLGDAGIKVSIVDDATQVRVNGSLFDPLVDGEPVPPVALRAPDGNRVGFRLVQTLAPVTSSWLAELAGSGARVLQYYPHQTHLVWASSAQVEALSTLGFVRWVGDFHPLYKLEPGIVGRQGLIENVDIMVFDDGAVHKTEEALRELGAVVLQQSKAQADGVFVRIIAALPADQVVEVVRLEAVLWIGHQSPEPGLDDEMSDQIVAGNHPLGVPETGYFPFLADLGYDGTGVNWATIDTGVDYDHPDFQGRIVGGYSFPGSCSAGSPPGDDCGGGHGTHVTGIIGGDAEAAYSDGAGFLYGLGMAPGYGIVALNSLIGTSWPPAAGWQENSKQGVLAGAIGGNNSWWTGSSNNGYQSTERTHDLMVRDGNFDTATTAEPFIEVFSAGNSGPSTGTLTAPKEAKNLIVVASTRNYRAGNIDSVSSFSSRGPAHDGRWVPTVAAPGEDIASARNDTGGNCTGSGYDISGTNNTYSLCSGTSMAAPHAAGALVLATQWWRGFNGDADPSPAMAKALLVNSAVDMGTADIPNINEGWGRIQIENLIRPDALAVYQDQAQGFDATGEEWTMTVGIADPAQPLKVTIAWSDAPGAVGANPALVNDLDLEVEVGGVTYLGNDFSAGWSTTGGSADNLNNLENVFVETVEGGSVNITVRATAVNGDGIPYTGDTTDQDFALVCFNCIERADFTLDLDPAAQSVCAPADAVYGITVGSLLGFDEDVTLGATGVPAGTTATFDTNPVAPPGVSTLTIGDTGSAAAGTSVITITGTSISYAHSRDVGLSIFTQTPGVASAVYPADMAVNVPARPTFEWTAPVQGESYRLELALDSGFADVVLDESGLIGTTFTPAADIATNTRFFWRLTSTNSCGTGATSPTWEFITEALPGDCSFGSVAVAHLEEDFESGAADWTHNGTQDTWQLSSARAYSGTSSYYGEGLGSTSDQYLVTPVFDLTTADGAADLIFWNYQHLEDRTSGCYDGGLVEASNDGGSTWTQLTPEPATDPYDGPFSTGSPAGQVDAWCGDPQDWTRTVVALDDYVGDTVQLRFRLATDGSVSREGWYVDDVKVQSCAATGWMFGDDFESGGTDQWSIVVGP